MRKLHLAIFALLLLSVAHGIAQQPPPTPAPAAHPASASPAPAAQPIPPPKPQILTPVDANSLKDLELAVERIKNYGHELNDLAEAANKAAQAQLAKDSKPTIDKQNEQIAIANREIEKIKLANKWGDDVGYDPQQEKFVRYPKPAQPVQPATPPAPDKK